jgi:NADH-quinone oxidoreductase subunit F
MNKDKKNTEILSPPVDIRVIDEIVARCGSNSQEIISILSEIQEVFGYLPEQALRRVSEITAITPGNIVGVASFYNHFRLKPAGRHTIKVCVGTACHVNGAETVYNAFRRHLFLAEGEDTDQERLFTVQKVACLGCCMLAPAVQIDDFTYGYLSAEKVPIVLKDFLSSLEISQKQESLKQSPSDNQTAIIRMCTCTSCQAAGALKVYRELEREILKSGIAVKLESVACTGISYAAPLLEIALPASRTIRYGRVTPQAVHLLLAKHFPARNFFKYVSGSVSALLERLLLNSDHDNPLRYLIDLDNPPYSLHRKGQKHLVTEYNGEIDPLNLASYQKHSGFTALARCLKYLTSAKIIEELTKSGLRGRGGGGFSTAQKWQTALEAGGDTRYLICNGDEGDPGAFMDRMILESFPFRVIEGLTIAAYTLQIKEAFLYIRREYPLAIKRMEAALSICLDNGLLGDNILGSGFSFKIKIVGGAGAFVCGEETALISALQGKRGMPRFKPPYPAQSGLSEKPTVVNNVETLASIPWIMLHGGEAFASLGTSSSKGTKTFALAGKIRHGGLVEVPMGPTLRQIIYEIGGGMQNDTRLKAVQIGGPSGVCLPVAYLDTPVDFSALKKAGAIMGSGGLIILDENDCMVDVARYFMQFTQSESCGKCTPCRLGTKRMLDILERICGGQGHSNDLEELTHLARIVQRTSLCGLGKTAPNPVLSTLKYFKEEYELHIQGKCPAKKCKALIRYVISDDCIGCTRCAQNCPSSAISSEPHKKHRIDTSLCIRCDTCRRVCPVKAVKVE